MALIAMAVYDTEENNRTWMTKATIISLLDTVNWGRHRLIIVDNASCQATRDLLNDYYKFFKEGVFELIALPENIGTARAINKAWMKRYPGENCIKMDNDVEIYENHWVDLMEEAIKREPGIGIIGLKRKDCIETPWHKDNWYRSRLVMLPHEEFQRWIIVEEVHHVMGTCQMYSSALLDKIGFLYQMGTLYGFDDALASVRAHVAGFRTVMLPHIEIEHIDPGGENPYTLWKMHEGSRMMSKFWEYKEKYESLQLSVYHGPLDK